MHFGGSKRNAARSCRGILQKRERDNVKSEWFWWECIGLFIFKKSSTGHQWLTPVILATRRQKS
jgi:hypothetical protein